MPEINNLKQEYLQLISGWGMDKTKPSIKKILIPLGWNLRQISRILIQLPVLTLLVATLFPQRGVLDLSEKYSGLWKLLFARKSGISATLLADWK